MTDQKQAAVAGLVALGSAAFAYGVRKADRKRDDRDEFVEVPIRG